MSMFNDISCDRKGNKEECLADARVVKVLAKNFGIGRWSFIGPGSEKTWYSGEENSPQGAWDHIADEMLLEFAESGHPTFRATTPLSSGTLKSKGHGKLSIHFTAQHATFSQLTQSKPKPICDRSGKPDNTEDVFVVKGETSRSHEIDEKGLHEELGSSDRRNLINCLKNTRVEQAHDGTGQLVEQNSSSTHTVKEQFAPEENRDIASFNTDNEFNRAIKEGEH